MPYLGYIITTNQRLANYALFEGPKRKPLLLNNLPMEAGGIEIDTNYR